MEEKQLLKDRIKAALEQSTTEAGGAMDTLAAVAGELEMKETVTGLKKVGAGLRSDNFAVIVVGRFKNGKSTILNALLGRLTHPVPELTTGKGPLPSDDLPCTATLTRIRYAEKPYVRVWKFDGKWEGWSLERYLNDSSVRQDEAETQKFFQDIREFELGFPAELCQSGVTLLDSPGTSDVAQRTEVTKQAVKACDAAIVVYRSDVFAGIDEREFASEEVLGSGTRVFTVVNMMYSRPVDERFKSFVWNRLIKDERAGVAYAGQDFSSQDIYFIDALKAQEGKFTSNAELVESSGLGLFEQRLGEFLVKDRHRTHLEKFIKTADLYSTTMDQQIAQRRAALDQDEKKLQQAYEAIQPQLEAIRGRRERLPKIFEHYRKEAQRELKASFEQVMARLREDLPGELKGRPLPSIPKGVAGVLAQFQQKKILKEALEVCNGIVTERLSLWSKNPPDKPGAQQALAPLLERLFDEIQEEVAKIEREYTDVHFQLTGWTPPADAPTSLVSTQERVLSGIAGLFVGDFAAVLGAAGGGWRGVAGNVAAQAGAGLVVVMLGITGPLVIPAILVAGLVGNIVGGSLGLEERVKKKVLEKVQEELRNAPQNATAQVEQQTEALFGQIETETMREVMAVIQDEEQNIRQMVEMNKRGLADKAKSRTALDEAARKVAAQRQALKEVIVRVQQTA